MIRCEASYTVEIALLMPLILLAVFLPIYAGYNLYGEVKKASVYVQEKSSCAEDVIRGMKTAKEFWEEKDDRI